MIFNMYTLSRDLLILLSFLYVLKYSQGFTFKSMFSSNRYSQSSSHQIQQSNYQNENHIIHRRRQSELSMQQFNPFSGRRNSRVKWYEADLTAFYAFVEEQPLLTATQELQYGKSLQLSIKVEKLRTELQLKLGPSTKVTNAELAEHMNTTVATIIKMHKCAEYSKTKLLNSNLKLVMAIVSRYRQSNIPNGELIAEGTRGLSRAVIRYDYTKGFRFATYATWYVHQAVSDYVRWRKNPTRIPSRCLNLMRKVKLFSAEYKTEMGQLPSVKDIAVKLNQPEFEIIKVLSMQQYPILMCSPIGTGNGYKDQKEKTYEDLLPSKLKFPSKHAESKDLRRDMERMMLSNLNDVERDVLRLRLGLDDGREKAVKEVGKKFQISWKTVRSVEKEALGKLLASKEISGFVDSYNSV